MKHKRSAIIAAAVTLIDREGVGISTARVAAEAGVSNGTLFNYFPTKQALIDSVYVEGLVHVSELGEDYFQYDNLKHQMLGERSAKRFRLGDRLRVRLVRADLESGRIDFVLARPVAGGVLESALPWGVACFHPGSACVNILGIQFAVAYASVLRLARP